MKLLIPFLALLAFGHATDRQDIDPEAIKDVFDELLKEDNIVLRPKVYSKRLALFTLGFWGGDDDDEISLELMYTPGELLGQNGARLLKELKPDEELQKREEATMSKRASRSPPLFDGRKRNGRTIINDVVSQESCGNCYLHTFVAALELAYTRTTGKRIKFSEQEMTDCYDNGCEGGDYRMVAGTMAYLDKLSPRNSYVTGGYLNGQFTCRADTTPDALDGIKVTGAIDVTVDTVQDAIYRYGSVMTCMKWGTKKGDACYMTGYKGGIVNFPAVENGCDHAVLIVGYAPSYYIVRNSHGVNWGERGYFRIRRGGNACGIEQQMAALVITPRSGSKRHRPNGCPLDKPNYCTKINTCIAGTRCVNPISQEVEEILEVEEVVEEEEVVMEEEVVEEEVVEEEVVEEEEVEERNIRIPGERKRRDEEEGKRKKGGGDDYYGKREVKNKDKLKNRDKKERKKGHNRKDWTIPGKINRMLIKRGVSAEALEEYYNYKRSSDGDEIEIEKRCADKSSACPAQKSRGVCTSKFAPYCLKTCNNCGSAPVVIPPESEEQQGSCLRPDIANGRVMAGTTLRAGQAVTVKCNPGYTLVGEKVKCQIQNVFTNDDKDARLLPECIKLGGETRTGNGQDYEGSKNSYTDQIGRQVECDSWNKDVLRGVLGYVENALQYKIGNHNYCRNPVGDQPVPFCLSSAGGTGKLVYCFAYPACDVCAGASDSYGTDYCSAGAARKKCDYKDVNSKAQISFFWDVCKATCCAKAGC